MKTVGEIESTKFQVCHQAQKTSQPKHAGRGPGHQLGHSVCSQRCRKPGSEGRGKTDRRKSGETIHAVKSIWGLKKITGDHGRVSLYND